MASCKVHAIHPAPYKGVVFLSLNLTDQKRSQLQVSQVRDLRGSSFPHTHTRTLHCILTGSILTQDTHNRFKAYDNPEGYFLPKNFQTGTTRGQWEVAAAYLPMLILPSRCCTASRLGCCCAEGTTWPGLLPAASCSFMRHAKAAPVMYAS